MTYSGCVRLAAVLVLALATGLACNTKEVPQVLGTSTGGSGGTGVAGPDAPAGSAADSVLAPGESCLAAGAPKRAPGQACNCATDCTTSVCQGGVCCSGAACGAKRPAGTTCDEPGDCDSGFCTDGVCCNVACTGACVELQPARPRGRVRRRARRRRGPARPLPAGRARDLRPERLLQRPGRLRQVFGREPPASSAAARAARSFVPAQLVRRRGGRVLAGIASRAAPSTCENGTCLTAAPQQRASAWPPPRARGELRPAG